MTADDVASGVALPGTSDVIWGAPPHVLLGGDSCLAYPADTDDRHGPMGDHGVTRQFELGHGVR